MNGKFIILALVVLVSLAAAGALTFYTANSGGGADTALSGAAVVTAEPDARGTPPLTAPAGVAALNPELRLPATATNSAAPAASSVSTGNTAQTAPAVADKPSLALPSVQSSISELAAVYREGGPAAADEFAARNGLKLKEGRVQVVIEAGDPGAAQTAVAAAGGKVEATHGNLVQAAIPVGRVASLADDQSVSYVRAPETPALAALSEGVADIGAPVWHGAGTSGAGVKVAVIDLGFQNYQDLINAGELPANVTLASFRGDGDITGGGERHGSACAEILYDVAPGVQLYLVNFNTDVELANAIDYVVAQDIDVVSASWSFFGNFRGDGQGAVNDMVAGAVDSGIFWANAAGNAARDHWSGAFTDTDGNTWHEFAPGDDGNGFNAAAGSTINVYLTWNKWPVTDQDYDMYLVYEGNPNKAVAAGDGWQGGSQAPSEQIHYIVPPGKGGRYWITIKNYAAAGDAVFKLYTYPLNLEHQTAAGSLAGQPTDSPRVMTVGAVPVNGTTLEYYSSRGPTVDGRVKPDIVAPTRVSTATYGAAGFWGTSASAPHAAGAGALVRSMDPALGPAQLQSFLEARATDLGDAGKDNLYGSGKLLMGLLPDLTPPLVTDVLPQGDVLATAATVSASFADPGGGIDTASVTVTLDGGTLPGCTVLATGVSCPVADLDTGTHVIGGSVSDLTGNISPISGEFSVQCGQPVLGMSNPRPHWASLNHFQQRLLSITYSFCNSGSNDAVGMSITGSSSTGGVFFASGLPAVVGDLARAAATPTCVDVTYNYDVPFGVTLFRTSTFASAGDSCGAVYAYGP